ncbi:hypothetical protein ACJZ2D_007668 [Fusarium nematophilum]
MKFLYLLNIASLAMAAPKASECKSLSIFDDVLDTSDPFIKSVWEDSISFKEADAVEARSVETSSESSLKGRACDRNGLQLCIAVCNTGCAFGCKCASCFSRCIDTCGRQFPDC